jgi:nucleotide-binding universal stress UspA family protein
MLDGQAAEITPWVEEGNAASVLLDAAADADLLVVGSRGPARLHQPALRVSRSMPGGGNPGPDVIILGG